MNDKYCMKVFRMLIRRSLQIIISFNEVLSHTHKKKVSQNSISKVSVNLTPTQGNEQNQTLKFVPSLQAMSNSPAELNFCKFLTKMHSDPLLLAPQKLGRVRFQGPGKAAL